MEMLCSPTLSIKLMVVCFPRLFLLIGKRFTRRNYWTCGQPPDQSVFMNRVGNTDRVRPAPLKNYRLETIQRVGPFGFPLTTRKQARGELRFRWLLVIA